MTTPTERIQRLREQTARATHAPWELGEVFGPYPEEPAIPVHTEVEPLVCAGVSVPDAEHMVRWDPQAAARALDLLALLFGKHTAVHLRLAEKDMCHACPATDWPCAYYTTALALLDTIDPPEVTS